MNYWIHLIALLCIFSSHRKSTAENTHPNILFILADDLGIGDLACYGNPHLDTPNIDALAAAGVRLTNHYAPSPLCAPSRAGFLTGRFNHRTGAVDVPSNRGLDRIALSEKTFGDYFRVAGYATALIGKWHNGLYCRDHLPHQRGFDTFFGFPNGGQDYWKWNLLRNDEPVPHDGRYLTDVLNEEAIHFIKKAKDSGKPFALILSHHVPHSPFQAPKILVDKYSNSCTKTVATIYAMIEAMDIGLGRVFKTLKEEELWQNTVIVFTSDNGAFLNKSTQRFHGDYSGNKGDVGEQGIRVPGIIAAPGRIPGGRIVSTPVHGCDWLPTLYSLTKAGPPPAAKPFDGVNIMPMLRGEAQSELASRKLMFQKNRYHPVGLSDAAIRQGKWKLVWPGVSVTMKKDSTRDNPSYLRGIVHPHWEMPLDRELGPAPAIEVIAPRLFDLSTDPAEQKNVAAEHPELVGEMARSYHDWFAEVMIDWNQSRKEILDHDILYWKGRPAPNPNTLYKDFWLWNRAPPGIDRETADPLKVFRGYWNQ